MSSQSNDGDKDDIAKAIRRLTTICNHLFEDDGSDSAMDDNQYDNFIAALQPNETETEPFSTHEELVNEYRSFAQSIQAHQDVVNEFRSFAESIQTHEEVVNEFMSFGQWNYANYNDVFGDSGDSDDMGYCSNTTVLAPVVIVAFVEGTFWVVAWWLISL